MQNAIKLENISNLITSPSSYQCRKTRLVHVVIHGPWPTHINGMYVCVLGIPKGKLSKQMKQKNLVTEL
jgi:ribonuclease I